MEIITHLIFFVIGYYLATFMFARHIKNVIKKIAQENGINPDELETPKPISIPILTTEEVGNGILVYDVKNNFMCQGNSLDEAAQNLLKYKQIKLAIILHNEKKFFFVEGKVEKQA